VVGRGRACPPGTIVARRGRSNCYGCRRAPRHPTGATHASADDGIDKSTEGGRASERTAQSTLPTPRSSATDSLRPMGNQHPRPDLLSFSHEEAPRKPVMLRGNPRGPDGAMFGGVPGRAGQGRRLAMERLAPDAGRSRRVPGWGFGWPDTAQDAEGGHDALHDTGIGDRGADAHAGRHTSEWYVRAWRYVSPASAARIVASSSFFLASTFGYVRSSCSTASTIAAATTSRVNHLSSAGTTNQGACCDAVARIASSYARM